VLGKPAGPDDDFFALGGTSLRAVRLAGEAGKRLGLTLHPDQIYQAPTPRGLAAALAGAPSPAPEGGGEGPLLRLSRGTGPAWVLLPPVSGRLDCYRELAALLEGRRNLWGLSLERLNPPASGAWGAWVEACSDALTAALPEGPLVLGGWSMGGLLAVDIARSLASRGRRVLRLILIDALAPDPLNSALVMNDASVLEELLERDLQGSLGGPGGEESKRRYRQHARALGGFTLRPIEVPLSLVVSEKTAQESPRLGWMAWSLMAREGMTCQLASGDHFSVLRGGSLRRIAEGLHRETSDRGAAKGVGA
jgi:thioesterase domain-containing protein